MLSADAAAVHLLRHPVAEVGALERPADEVRDREHPHRLAVQQDHEAVAEVGLAVDRRLFQLGPLAGDREEALRSIGIERRQKLPLLREQLGQRLGVRRLDRAQLDLLYHRRDAQLLRIQGL